MKVFYFKNGFERGGKSMVVKFNWHLTTKKELKKKRVSIQRASSTISVCPDASFRVSAKVLFFFGQRKMLISLGLQ